MTYFAIKSYSWQGLSRDSRSHLVSLLGVSPSEAQEFCDAFFGQFFLLHKIGHIIDEVFSEGPASHPARSEYLANLFAIKYLQCKSEYGYLDTLTRTIGRILDLHGARFDFDLEEMSRLFPKYKLDLKTYTVFHFNAFQKCQGDERSLDEVVGLLSGDRIKHLNPFILWKKGARGEELINECVQKVFEFSGVMPEVRVTYASTFLMEDFEIQRPRGQT